MRIQDRSLTHSSRRRQVASRRTRRSVARRAGALAAVSLTIGKRYDLSGWVRTEALAVRDLDRSPIATGAAQHGLDAPVSRHGNAGAVRPARARVRDNEDVAQAIQTLFEYLEGGDSLEDFLEGFPTARSGIGGAGRGKATVAGTRLMRLLIDECVDERLRLLVSRPRVPNGPLR